MGHYGIMQYDELPHFFGAGKIYLPSLEWDGIGQFSWFMGIAELRIGN